MDDWWRLYFNLVSDILVDAGPLLRDLRSLHHVVCIRRHVERPHRQVDRLYRAELRRRPLAVHDRHGCELSVHPLARSRQHSLLVWRRRAEVPERRLPDGYCAWVGLRMGSKRRRATERGLLHTGNRACVASIHHNSHKPRHPGTLPAVPDGGSIWHDSSVAAALVVPVAFITSNITFASSAMRSSSVPTTYLGLRGQRSRGHRLR